MKSKLKIFFALAFVIFLTRLPALHSAAHEDLFSQDELEMTLSTADRFLGVPSMSLAWPGATYQLFALPILAVDYLFHCKLHVSISGFASYLAANYASPWHYIYLLRLLTAIMTSLGFASLFFPLRHWMGNRVTAALACLLIATLPDLWFYSHTATADGFSVAFACFALSALYLDLDALPAISLSGFCFGLALAAKVTILPLLFLCLGAALEGRRAWRRMGLIFLGACALGFLVGNPYVWVDAIRFAKSTLGNVLRPGGTVGIARVFTVLEWEMGVGPMLLVLPGLWWLIKSHRWSLALGFGLTLLFGFHVLAGASDIQARYVLSLAVACALSAAFALALFERALPSGNGRRTLFVVTAGCLALATAIESFYGYRTSFWEASRDWPEQRLAAEIARSDETPGIHLVPFELLYFTVDQPSAEELGRLADGVEKEMRNGGAIRKFAEKRGLPGNAMEGLWTDFSEDEQALVARVTLMGRHRSHGKALRYYSIDADTAKRVRLPNAAEALAMFRSGEASSIILNQKADGLTPAKVLGGNLYYYVQRSSVRAIGSLPAVDDKAPAASVRHP